MENLEFVDAHVHFYDMQHPVLTAAIGSPAFAIVNSSPLQRGHPDTSFQAYKMDELGATQPPVQPRSGEGRPRHPLASEYSLIFWDR